MVASDGEVWDFRIVVRRLIRLSGLPVAQVARLVGEDPRRPSQALSSPLYDRKRSFQPDLVLALDSVFAQRIPNYAEGSLFDAYRTGDLDHLVRFLGGGPPPLSPSPTPADPPPPVVTSGGSPRRRRAALVVALGLALTAVVWIHLRPITVIGTVSCRSGAPVTGVWVGWIEAINWGAFAESPTQGPRPGEWEFVAHTPVVPTWTVHVGCGGTPAVWAVRTQSGPFAANPIRLVCDDSPGQLGPGRCLPVG